MPPDSLSKTVAYQRVRLEEIRDLYQELDLDLDQYLNVELEVSKRLDSAEEDASVIREMFSSLGMDLRDIKPDEDSGSTASSQAPQSKKYRKIELGNADDFQALAEEAETYLAKAGVDLGKDPLLQVISSAEASGTVAAYREKYGDVSWDRSDYLIVVFAGFVATLLDIFLVRIPPDPTRWHVDGVPKFLGEEQKYSPLTKWLREHSKEVHDRFLKQFEKKARVPYDDVRHPDVAGMSPKTHRYESFGHDPILGFIFGIIDILGNTGTYIDQHGDIIRVDKLPADPVGLTAAFLKVILHLLSDVCTSAGIQPPFFTLLQLVKADSPFVLPVGSQGKEGGAKVPWTDVARYMYVHGYDLRHFATMGIVPATVEMVIRGWRLCESYEKEENPELTKAKTSSMLMLGHTMVVSGNLIKTGAIYGMNPLALNWAQALWMFPVTVSWLKESMKRDRRIKATLDAEWASMYFTRSTLPNN